MGFFRKEQLITKTKRPQRRQCGACDLFKRCTHPKIDVSGGGNRNILIVSDNPTTVEDRTGQTLSGKGGQYLGRKLKTIGVDLQKDCWKTNSILCKVTDKDGKSRKPTVSEIDYCRPSLLKTLKEKQPKIIILLNSMAVQSFLGDRWQKNLGGIEKWRGWAIPDKDYNAWVFPLYAPDHILRMKEQHPVIETVFNNDIKNIKKYLDKPFPDLPDGDKCCEVLTRKDDVVAYLEELLKYKATFAFDYETTGLKPHAKGHRIASVGMCWQENKAVAWEWKLTPIPIYRKIMENPKIRKIAANMKMEDHWTTGRARGIKVNGWLWDTMNAAHIEDQRKGITSLKFDVYKRYGVVDYDSAISDYLKSDSKEFGANGMNRVFETPRKELVLYNAKDAFYTYHLAIDQMREIGVMPYEGQELFMS